MVQVAEKPEQATVVSIEKPHETPEGWEPNVVAFACHYCAFAAADLAGVMRLSYSPSVKIIRLPCTASTTTITSSGHSKSALTASLRPADSRANAITWKVICSRNEE